MFKAISGFVRCSRYFPIKIEKSAKGLHKLDFMTKAHSSKSYANEDTINGFELLRKANAVTRLIPSTMIEIQLSFPPQVLDMLTPRT